MKSLEGKVAWVTGATSGIGRACVQMLWNAGATVVVSARNAEAVEALVAAYGSERVLGIPLDVSNAQAVAAAGEQMQSRLDGVDILVNAAGINVGANQLRVLSTADWLRVVDINLNGAFHCMQAVLPGMRAKCAGTIVNISSWSGRYPTPATGASYNAAKQAMASLTLQAAAEESANGIRACTIYPGETDTPILSKRAVPVPPEVLALMLQPEDVAAAVHMVVHLPPRATVNELVITPTWNRALLGVQPPPQRLAESLRTD